MQKSSLLGATFGVGPFLIAAGLQMSGIISGVFGIVLMSAGGVLTLAHVVLWAWRKRGKGRATPSGTLTLEWKPKQVKRLNIGDQILGRGQSGDVSIYAEIGFGVREPGIALALEFEIYGERLPVEAAITLTQAKPQTYHVIIPKRLAVSPAECRFLAQWEKQPVYSNHRRLEFPEEGQPWTDGS